MKKSIFFLSTALIAVNSMTFAQPGRYPRDSRVDRIQEIVANDNTKIQVALLLDTSNSMDGLIDQAKSRLWNIINTIASLKFRGQTPTVEIALYEYGNDNISAANNYVRQVAAFTTDLDLISEKLFSLRTNGGQEYCGAVIKKSIDDLKWSAHPEALKFIYIAGNEPFSQGPMPYRNAIQSAVNKKVYVSTIFCGNRQEGINTSWADGASRGNGKYFNIDSDEKIRYIETPYDDRLEVLNTRLNDTYIAYGAEGETKKAAQVTQDMNAASVSKAYKAERAVSKSKKAYTNTNWDLVDAAANAPATVENLSQEDMPSELKGKSKEEVKQYIAQKNEERKAIQEEIAAVSKQRAAYIEKEQESSSANNQDDLGTSINKSIIEVAKTNGYVME